MEFFRALFDISFTEFVTARLIKVLYALSIAMIVFIYFWFVFAGFSQSAALGFFMLLIVGPILALFWAIVVRVVLEFNMVLFRIYENTQHIAAQNGQTPIFPSSVPSFTGSVSTGASPAVAVLTPPVAGAGTPSTP